MSPDHHLFVLAEVGGSAFQKGSEYLFYKLEIQITVCWIQVGSL